MEGKKKNVLEDNLRMCKKVEVFGVIGLAL